MRSKRVLVRLYVSCVVQAKVLTTSLPLYVRLNIGPAITYPKTSALKTLRPDRPRKVGIVNRQIHLTYLEQQKKHQFLQTEEHNIPSRTMRHLAVALLTLCGLLSLGAVLADEGQYTTKFDNVDIDAILNNERLLNGYVGCLLDRNPCTPDAAELKKNLPDALEHDCAGCSEMQKNAADKISHHLIDNKQDEWRLLEEKYDPTGAYRRRYLENKSQDGSKVD